MCQTEGKHENKMFVVCTYLHFCCQVDVSKSSSFQSYSPVRWGGQVLPLLLSTAVPAVQPGILGILSHLGQVEHKDFWWVLMTINVDQYFTAFVKCNNYECQT